MFTQHMEAGVWFCWMIGLIGHDSAMAISTMAISTMTGDAILRRIFTVSHLSAMFSGG